MKPIALITGASSGIGQACARIMADKFYLIICGRREAKLDSLAKELHVFTDVHKLVFDVRNREEVTKSIDSLPKQWKDIDVLINNAGNAHGLDFIHEGDTDDWDAMMDINVKGLLYVTKAITPRMVERKSGQIINIGSIAGVDTYPRGNVYCASKSAVATLTTGMRQDLHRYGIRVGEIKPGLVQTEFSQVRFKGNADKAEQVYHGYQPLKADDVANAVLYMATRPKHVNIADMLILPTDQAGSTLVNKSGNW
jgi:NADP-dependent 3-hydroxy acid dehydrogenase YdfG